MAKQARGKAAKAKPAKKPVAKAKPAKRSKGKTAAKAPSKFRRPTPAKPIRKPRPAAQVAFAMPIQSSRVLKDSGYIAGLAKFDASQARSGLPEIMNRANYRNEHIALAKHGDVKVVVIDRAEYERFRAMEDFIDGTEAMRALREFEESGEKAISSADVLKRLGIK